METRQKILLTGVSLLGGLASLASIARMITLSTIGPYDFSCEQARVILQL